MSSKQLALVCYLEMLSLCQRQYGALLAARVNGHTGLSGSSTSVQEQIKHSKNDFLGPKALLCAHRAN
jgi:hypothetical protein